MNKREKKKGKIRGQILNYVSRTPSLASGGYNFGTITLIYTGQAKKKESRNTFYRLHPSKAAVNFGRIVPCIKSNSRQDSNKGVFGKAIRILH